jgi:hypothetical protein
VTQHPTDDLGLYALGLLDRAERDEIERHLADCALCQTELAAHRSTLAALAPEPAMPAAADLRQRIVARHERSWWRGLPALGYAASAVLAVALVVAVSALVQAQTTRDEYARALSAVATGARVIPLQAQADSRLRGALVIPREGASYLVLELPPPPAGRAYEAWVIRGGVPTAAGMAPTLTGVITMQLHEQLRSGDATAITLEDAAGAQAPTSTPLLLGQV